MQNETNEKLNGRKTFCIPKGNDRKIVMKGSRAAIITDYWNNVLLTLTYQSTLIATSV